MTSPLTDVSLAEGVRTLTQHDPDMRRVVAQYGRPPLWGREPGFPTLLWIILEQQVSLASARAAYTRLCAEVTPLTPDGFLHLDNETLKRAGFSRQKAGYGRGLAQAIVDGRLDLEAVAEMGDTEVRNALIAMKGIGRWTADIYLLMALRRPDVWPNGDLALAIAVQRVKQLDTRPTQDALERMSAAWEPWRAVAARIFWQYYLNA